MIESHEIATEETLDHVRDILKDVWDKANHCLRVRIIVVTPSTTTVVDDEDGHGHPARELVAI